MKVKDRPQSEQEERNDYSVLQAEASRLLDFKKKHIKRQNQTPCPACTMLVSIKAHKCPHCSTDVAAHTALAREELGKLNEITAELYELHKKHGERQEAARRPIWESAQEFFADPVVREDLRILLPATVVFFAIVLTLRLVAGAPVFWIASLVGGIAAYVFLKRSNFRRYITVDLYRVALVFGLTVILSSALQGPLPSWSAMFAKKVEVQRPVANIRESATTDSRIVATVQQGEKLKVVGEQGSWYQIQTGDGQTGWVYSQLVK